MAFDYAIVLTGGIATGKSTVVKCFLEAGFTVIDADKIAHQILDEQSEKIAKMFGDTLVKEGKVKRKALGAIVFSDTAKRKKLETLLHPLIYDKIEQQAQKLDRLKRPYIIDIPLFFETERYPIEKSIVVYAREEQQLERLMQRDGYNTEEARKRIASQISIEEKRKRATYVIDNTYDLKQLKDACDRVKEDILGDFR